MEDTDSHTIFVYGTLLVTSVWDALIGRVPEMHAGILRGFRRRNIRSMGLPAIYPVAEGDAGMVIGQVAFITTLEFQALIMSKGFEDDEFSISKVKVQNMDSEDMEEVECNCYVWKEDFEDGLESNEWDFDRWQQEELWDYVEMCRDSRIQREDEHMDFDELREKAMLRSRQEEERVSEAGTASRRPSKDSLATD
eukprot:gnl/MRDRNA2_/MRDRNA2_94033_c0_seq1.p1 gnl/MRDRNA2_/MRDRNA2_94033_c0~~gnl/MRDRNA2_/MRDRNA2_94033_c0_seq1.p1  ORF type:complete len:224 (-),score=56.81 gnl/MRDRNA2_/MRDRNA2_94033_c0_seq1:149-733(-)